MPQRRGITAMEALRGKCYLTFTDPVSEDEREAFRRDTLGISSKNAKKGAKVVRRTSEEREERKAQREAKLQARKAQRKAAAKDRKKAERKGWVPDVYVRESLGESTSLQSQLNGFASRPSKKGGKLTDGQIANWYADFARSVHSLKAENRNASINALKAAQAEQANRETEAMEMSKPLPGRRIAKRVPIHPASDYGARFDLADSADNES